VRSGDGHVGDKEQTSNVSLVSLHNTFTAVGITGFTKLTD